MRPATPCSLLTLQLLLLACCFASIQAQWQHPTEGGGATEEVGLHNQQQQQQNSTKSSSANNSKKSTPRVVEESNEEQNSSSNSSSGSSSSETLRLKRGFQPCTVSPVLCQQGTFLQLVTDSRGCPKAACGGCTEDTTDRPECSGNTCPPLVALNCTVGNYLANGLDAAGCPVLRCLPCTAATASRPGCEAATTPKPAAACPHLDVPNCPQNYYVRYFKDADNCSMAACTICSEATRNLAACQPLIVSTQPPCPVMDAMNCPPGTAVYFYKDSNNCTLAGCRLQATTTTPPAIVLATEPQVECPEIAMPMCALGSYLHYGTDSQGCPTASCELCTPETAEEPACQRATATKTPCPHVAARQDCPVGTYPNFVNDTNGCLASVCTTCTEATAGRPECQRHKVCPELHVPVCEVGFFVKEMVDANGCPTAECQECTEAEVKLRPECNLTNLTHGTKGCSQANKPVCSVNEVAMPQRLNNSCHWICQSVQCPPNVQPPVCTAGQYRKPAHPGSCIPWTCQPCDFENRNVEGCREVGPNCEPLNWSEVCPVHHFRSVHVNSVTECLEIRCASCQTDVAADVPMPSECNAECPQPLTLCPSGQTAEFGRDGRGCPTAVCRLCREGEACYAFSKCSHRNLLPQQPSDCEKNFYLGTRVIDGCEAKICLPCRVQLGTKFPQCADSTIPDTCGEVQLNCTIGLQGFKQVTDSNGCPQLVCHDCPPENSHTCPINQRETPLPTKWAACQQFTCVNTPVTPAKPFACPTQKWLPSPTEYSTEIVKVGECTIRKYGQCPPPAVNCPPGYVAMLTDETQVCQYRCEKLNGTGLHGGNCFPGRHDVVFLIDMDKSKSLFQIKFQVASFIAKFVRQVSEYGTNGVQVGAVLYSSHVLQVISPDEASTAEEFFKKFLHAEYDSETGTATGEAVKACANLLRSLRRPDTKKSVIVLTDTSTTQGISVTEAARMLGEDTDRYFVTVSSIWDEKLREEAVEFATSPSRVLELPSYHLLASNGVQQLFPQCSSTCGGVKLGLGVDKKFLEFLQSSIENYENWIFEIQTSLARVYHQLDSVQYGYESGHVRLELCSRMVSHYRRTVESLTERLKSVEQQTQMSTTGGIDFQSSLRQVHKLEQQLKTLTARRSELTASLKTVRQQIVEVTKRMTELREKFESELQLEQTKIEKFEKQITERWQTLQQLTQEVVTKRMASKNAQTLLGEKQSRIRDIVVLNSDLAVRIRDLTEKITVLRNSTSSVEVDTFTQSQETLAKCEEEAKLEGFEPAAAWTAGTQLRLRQVLSALINREEFNWMSNSSSAEYHQYSRLRQFTVAAYKQTKLVVRNAAGRLLAFLTFRTTDSNFLNFFGPRNLIDCYPWKVETLKESVGINWQLFNSTDGTAFGLVRNGGDCRSRKFLLAAIIGAGACSDYVTGPFPRFKLTTGARMEMLQELSDAASVELLVKPLLSDSPNSRWLPGMVISTDMPVTLRQLLQDRLLSFSQDTAPAALFPGVFFKSQLLRSPSFTRRMLRLTGADGSVHAITFDGVLPTRGGLLNATGWSAQALESAPTFAATAPYRLTIGTAAPCTPGVDGTATGFVHVTDEISDCLVALSGGNATAGWIGLVAGVDAQPAAWSSAGRVRYLELLMQRPLQFIQLG